MRSLSLRLPIVGACCALLFGGFLVVAAPSSQPTSKVTTSGQSQSGAPKKGDAPKAGATTHPVSRWSYHYLDKLPVPPISIGQLKGTVLVYSGGLKSYFEPCGCQAEMLGGLGRVLSLLKGYQHRGLQVLPVDAGNLFFEALMVKKAKRKQSELKAEMVADLFRSMGVRVMGVGPFDLTFGLNQLKSLLQRSGMLALSANLVYESTGKPVFQGRTILQVGKRRIGFVGLLGYPEIPAGTPAVERKKKEAESKAFWSTRKLRVTSALAAAKREVAALRKSKVDLIVLLSTLGVTRLQQVLPSVKGIDIAIEGSEDSAFDPPQRVGKTFLLSTPKEGQKVGIFAMYLRPQSKTWSAVETPAKRKEALKAMVKQVKVYEKQATQMRKQGKAFAPIAKVYESQANELLKKMVIHRKTLQAPPSLASGHRGFFHLMLSVSSTLPEFPTAVKRVKRYQKEVKIANLAALQLIKPVLKDKHGNFYIGANRCKTCHGGAYQFWKKTRHANAFATLVKRKKQFDLDCIGCHVVGWQKPGGLYNIKTPGHLGNVQCENCHNIGGLHAAQGGKKGLIRGHVTASVCTQCHNGTHDPKFNFLSKVKKILGKGHGEARLAIILKTEKKK